MVVRSHQYFISLLFYSYACSLLTLILQLANVSLTHCAFSYIVDYKSAADDSIFRAVSTAGGGGGGLMVL